MRKTSRPLTLQRSKTPPATIKIIEKEDGVFLVFGAEPGGDGLIRIRDRRGWLDLYTADRPAGRGWACRHLGGYDDTDPDSEFEPSPEERERRLALADS